MKIKNYLFLALLLIQGCAASVPRAVSTDKLKEIQLGETREDIVKRIGPPASVRTSVMEDADKTQYDRYHLYHDLPSWKTFLVGIVTLGIGWVCPCGEDDYWLKYTDGKLTRFDIEDKMQVRGQQIVRYRIPR